MCTHRHVCMLTMLHGIHFTIVYICCGNVLIPTELHQPYLCDLLQVEVDVHHDPFSPAGARYLAEQERECVRFGLGHKYMLIRLQLTRYFNRLAHAGIHSTQGRQCCEALRAFLAIQLIHNVLFNIPLHVWQVQELPIVASSFHDGNPTKLRFSPSWELHCGSLSTLAMQLHATCAFRRRVMTPIPVVIWSASLVQKALGVTYAFSVSFRNAGTVPRLCPWRC